MLTPKGDTAPGSVSSRKSPDNKKFELKWQIRFKIKSYSELIELRNSIPDSHRQSVND